MGFYEKNMLVSRAYDKSTISQSNKDYDTFVVGSDIVWGMPVTGHDFTYMLDFVEDAKKKLHFHLRLEPHGMKMKKSILKNY